MLACEFIKVLSIHVISEKTEFAEVNGTVVFLGRFTKSTLLQMN